MVQRDRPTVLARVSGFFIFFGLTIACFSWFIWSTYNICDLIFSKAQVVYFDKGSLYMFGAGIGLSSLTFAILYEGVFRRELTEKVTKFITRSALIGVLFMFFLPNALHYLSSIYLAKNEYVVCSDASYQWLLYKEIVYTDNKFTCEALVKESEITKSSSGR